MYKILLLSGLVFMFCQQPRQPADKDFQTNFRYSPAKGLGLEEGICRRDPSDIIKVNGTYYVWYTKVIESPDVFRYPSGYSGTVWYATSTDGFDWTEQGQAVGKGGPGTWDEEGTYTPNILVAEGKYYLTYDGADRPFSETNPCSEGMAVSDSPDGPWTKLPNNPINTPTDDSTRFDSFRVCDGCLIVRDGKYWWYYKGRGQGLTPRQTKMGVQIADNPTGPYVKSDLNPLIKSGHEVLVWPYFQGVVSLVGPVGPEKNTVQYAPDGLHFIVKAHVTDVPKAPGAYRPDAFTDTDFGQGVQWGISMVHGPHPYLVRFDCDLAVE
jgi:hypothetical protein